MYMYFSTTEHGAWKKKWKWVTQKHSSCLFDNLHEVNNFSTFDSLVSVFQALGQWAGGNKKMGRQEAGSGRERGEVFFSLLNSDHHWSRSPLTLPVTDSAHRWPCLSLILLIAGPACRLPASCFDHPGYNFSQCSYFISHLLQFFQTGMPQLYISKLWTYPNWRNFLLTVLSWPGYLPRTSKIQVCYSTCTVCTTALQTVES